MAVSRAVASNRLETGRLNITTVTRLYTVRHGDVRESHCFPSICEDLQPCVRRHSSNRPSALAGKAASSDTTDCSPDSTANANLSETRAQPKWLSQAHRPDERQ